MKKFIALLVMVLTALSTAAAPVYNLSDDDVRQSLYGALDKAADALQSAPFGNAPVAILPMSSGYAALAGRVKNMLVQAGFVCVEGKEDPMWNEIIKEIEWDERKEDILDPGTLVKFGRLKAARILFQCIVRVVDKNADRVYAEVELRATDIATKQIVWGGTFANRYYIGKDVQGIIKLDDDLRMLLKKNFAMAQLSLAAPNIAGKFNNIKTIIVVPLCGDIKTYMTDMATVMLTQTNFYPRNPHIPSLTQIRAAARDGQLAGDAVLYGSVRALHKVGTDVVYAEKKVITNYNIVADIQLFIEDVKTGNILWGETITIKEPASDYREMTAQELKEYRQDKIDALPDEIKEEVVDNWKKYLLILGGIICAIAVFFLIVIGIKAFVSYNNVR